MRYISFLFCLLNSHTSFNLYLCLTKNVNITVDSKSNKPVNWQLFCTQHSYLVMHVGHKVLNVPGGADELPLVGQHGIHLVPPDCVHRWHSPASTHLQYTCTVSPLEYKMNRAKYLNFANKTRTVQNLSTWSTPVQCTVQYNPYYYCYYYIMSKTAQIWT